MWRVTSSLVHAASSCTGEAAIKRHGYERPPRGDQRFKSIASIARSSRVARTSNAPRARQIAFNVADGWPSALLTASMRRRLPKRSPVSAVSVTPYCVRNVALTGVLPVITTAIAHQGPGVGMIGAGITHPPVECFHQAVSAIADGGTVGRDVETVAVA